MPSRRCLACLGQYEPGHVQMERDGLLEDPSYIEGLSEDHELRSNENVFPFALNSAGLAVLQMLSFVIAPVGVSNVGEFCFNFTGGVLDRIQNKTCDGICAYNQIIAQGDTCEYRSTDRHRLAEQVRAEVSFDMN